MSRPVTTWVVTFADLQITNEDFQTTIESISGVTTIVETFDSPVTIAADGVVLAGDAAFAWHPRKARAERPPQASSSKQLSAPPP